MADDIEQLLLNDLTNEQISSTDSTTMQRERILAVISGGNSKKVFGKQYTTIEIESLSDKDLIRLYARYEAYIGGIITRSLKETLCSTYIKAVEIFCPPLTKGRVKLENSDQLMESLSENPLIDITLSSLACGLFHKYGSFLTPIAVGLITSNHLTLNSTNTHTDEQPSNKYPQENEPTANNIQMVSP